MFIFLFRCKVNNNDPIIQIICHFFERSTFSLHKTLVLLILIIDIFKKEVGHRQACHQYMEAVMDHHH